MVIFLVILLGVGYLWMYCFELLFFGEVGSDVFVWDCWIYCVCVLIDNGEVMEWCCDNVMEIDGFSSNINLDVLICKCMWDVV